MTGTPPDVLAAADALAEARRFAAREAPRRGALALLAAAAALVLIAASALLHLGALALLPVLALGPAQARLARWSRLTPDERRLPPASHVALSFALAAGLLALGIARDRTDLLPAAAVAATGALIALQGVRAHDRAMIVLGTLCAGVAAAAPFLPVALAGAILGIALAVAASLLLAAMLRLTRPGDAHAQA